MAGVKKPQPIQTSNSLNYHKVNLTKKKQLKPIIEVETPSLEIEQRIESPKKDNKT